MISYFRISIFVNLESLIISAFQGNSGKWMQLQRICKYILQRLVVSDITSNSGHFPFLCVFMYVCVCCNWFLSLLCRFLCCQCYWCYRGRCYRKCSRFSEKWSLCWHRNFPPQWTFALYVHSEVNLRKMGWKWKYKSENQNMKVTVQIYSSILCPFFSSSLDGRISFSKYFPSFPFPFPWPNNWELRFHWLI